MEELGVIIFLLGLAVGSFLNVCIYRIPRKRSILRPFSYCPSCGKTIRFYDNVPLLSFILLKGKCRECKSRIPVRYPLVELLTGVIFYSLYTTKGIGVESLVFMVLLCLLIVISFIDLEFQIIPDLLSVGGMFAGFAFSFFRNPHFHLKDAIYGTLFGGGVLFIIAYIYEFLAKREGMGFGDVKLLAMIGSFLGVRGAIFSLISGAFFGTILGIVLIAGYGKNLKYAIPFGPFLSLGAATFIFFGDTLTWFLIRTIFARGL
ncbi:MAG: prepilin peptidase [Desulfobacterota bacterium]|nr:prepilin peptidase [Thermodesulfobacteriota bacterium]MDW8002218.1 prepilin peptidase [Deltaproteobacteria bacterium]